MKRRLITICLTFTLVSSIFCACGADNTVDTDSSGETQTDSVGGGTSETASSSDFSSDSIEGEWDLLCDIYHFENSDGDSGDNVTMYSDDYLISSKVSIQKKDDKYYVDYMYSEEGYSLEVYGRELTLSDDGKTWTMPMPDTFNEYDGEENYREFYINDDGRLVATYDFYNEYPEDNYYFSSQITDIYLRKDSPEFDDPESLRYFDTVTVSNAEDLVNSIQNNRKIILKEGFYDISEIPMAVVDNPRIDYLYGGAIIASDVSNFCLEAEEGADVQICIDEPSSPVLSFESGKNITVRGLTVGHTVEPGYCSGSVLYFDNSSNITVDKCRLYGSGTYGVEAYNTYGMDVTDTDIYECTYGLVYLNNVGGINFTNCTMRDSSDLSMINTYDAYDVIFESCEFTGNMAAAYDTVYFVEIGEYDRVVFRNCTFKDNYYNSFSNREVTIENCKAENNHATYNDIMNSSEADEPLDKDAVFALYDEAVAKQEEIDEKLQSDTLLDQLSLNQLAYDKFEIWDDLLNQVWAYLGENLSEEEMTALRDEQQKWIREKEASMKDAGANFEGGTMQTMVEYGEGAALTRQRVEALINKYLG